jgi:cell pole-organizing protein PopZ
MEAGGSVEAKKPGSGGEQDLSMEEILQSIRRIIAEDDKDAPTEESPVADKKGEDVPGSDILELTEMLKEDGSVVNVKDEPPEPVAAAPQPAAKMESPSDVMAKINEALGSNPEAPKPEVAPTPVAAPAPAPAPVAVAASEPAASLDSLLSDEVAAATAAQFKRLGNKLPPEVHVASPPFRSGTTVEDLVTEMLRPMMKEWLDINLPQIVERIVEREVRKLTQ